MPSPLKAERIGESSHDKPLLAALFVVNELIVWCYWPKSESLFSGTLKMRRNHHADSKGWRTLLCTRVRGWLRAWHCPHSICRTTCRNADGRTDGSTHHAYSHGSGSAVVSSTTPSFRFCCRPDSEWVLSHSSSSGKVLRSGNTCKNVNWSCAPSGTDELAEGTARSAQRLNSCSEHRFPAALNHPSRTLRPPQRIILARNGRILGS